MRLIWELFRVAWAVGCLPVGELLLVVVVFSGFNLTFFLGLTCSEDPAIRWMFWVLVLYFVGGGWLFSRVNQIYADKLRKVVAGYQAEGFHPQVEVFAKINDAYVGVDLESKMLLAYPVGQDGHLFRLDEIQSFRILPIGKSDHRLELLTSDLAIPTFSLALRTMDVTNTEARLHAIFST